MARVVVNVAGVVSSVHTDSLLRQVVMNVHHSAARENGFKVVLLQLVQAGAAAHQNGGNVCVVERISNTVEEHAIARHDIVALFAQSVAFLRVPQQRYPAAGRSARPCHKAFLIRQSRPG